MENNQQIQIGSIVKINTEATHQESQKPLNGMYGSVYHKDEELDEYIVSVAELNGIQLPFSASELVLIDNSSALLLSPM